MPDPDDDARARSWRLPLLAAAASALVLVGLTVLLRSDDGLSLSAPEPSTTTTTAPAETTTTTSPFPACTPVPPGTGPVGPLSGLPVEAPGAEARSALIVKIDNYEPDARPQAGLTRADVVYEEKVEGPLSRFAAIFHSTSSNVGPVRSARSTDLLIAAPLNRPLFAYSGANPTFQARVSSAPLVDVGAGRSGAYWRDGAHAAPHNLFASTTGLWAGAPSSPPPALWPFRAAGTAPAGGQPGTSVAYHFGGGVTSVRWEWDEATGRYLRWQGGTPHIDTDFCQAAAENVVIQLVDYVDSGVKDSAGGAIPEAALVGSGTGWVLTGGQAVPMTWQRDTPDALTAYLGPDGQPIAMAPGHTWIALVPRTLGATID